MLTVYLFVSWLLSSTPLLSFCVQCVLFCATQWKCPLVVGIGGFEITLYIAPVRLNFNRRKVMAYDSSYIYIFFRCQYQKSIRRLFGGGRFIEVIIRISQAWRVCEFFLFMFLYIIPLAKSWREKGYIIYEQSFYAWNDSSFTFLTARFLNVDKIIIYLQSRI